MGADFIVFQMIGNTCQSFWLTPAARYDEFGYPPRSKSPRYLYRTPHPFLGCAKIFAAFAFKGCILPILRVTLSHV